MQREILLKGKKLRLAARTEGIEECDTLRSKRSACFRRNDSTIRTLTSKEIGQKVKQRRKDLGISQQRLAEKLGVTQQQVLRYETGVNCLTVENIQKIACFLNVPLAYFFLDRFRGKSGPDLNREEKALLKQFRKIETPVLRRTVIGVARLSAQVRRGDRKEGL